MLASLKRYGDCEKARDAAFEKIDQAAEKARSVPAAQEAIYQRKLAEARNLEGETPLVDAESELLGLSREEVADRILAARSLWEARAVEIEVLRMKAKNDVRVCETSLEMHRIAKAFEDTV